MSPCNGDVATGEFSFAVAVDSAAVNSLLAIVDMLGSLLTVVPNVLPHISGPAVM